MTRLRWLLGSMLREHPLAPAVVIVGVTLIMFETLGIVGSALP